MSQEIKKRPSFKVMGVLFLIIVAPVLWIMFNKTGIHYSRPLPIYFERELAENGDTIYHTIDNFKLRNQMGDSVTLADYKDKIMLVSFFFASCENLVADEGSVLFSSNQIRQKKPNELPDNIVILATTSQILESKSDGLRTIKKKYDKNYPSNITTIKYFEKAKDEDFLQYGSTAKNLYLLLLEDL